jgi:hypothetical protein
MILDFIYSVPTWLWGSIVLVVLDGSACLGLVIFHRLLHIEVRRAHNDLTGFTVAVISVTYAVLLAFIAIATWESYASAVDIVDREADCVGSIYRDTQGLPASMGDDIRSDINAYVTTVIDQEWPQQQAGKLPTQGWEPLRKVHSAIVTMQPKSLGEAVIQAELLRSLNMLYSARSSRISAAQGHIPKVIWWIIFLGGALTVGYTYLFGFHEFWMHLITTGAVATSLALVVILIIALDWPFRGRVSVSPDAFIDVQQSWKDLTFAPAAAPPPAFAIAPEDGQHP